MPCICVVRCLALVASLGWMAEAHAQSIDPNSAQLTLHQPFALRILVRIDDAATGQRIASCIEADFQNGDAHLVSDDMRVTHAPASRIGWHEVLFQHPHVIKERAVLARVVLRCPARFEREFVLEAMPTVHHTEPPSLGALVSSSPPHPASQKPLTRAQGQLERPNARQIASVGVRDNAAPSRQAPSSPTPDPTAFAQHPSAPQPDIEDPKALETEIQQLRSELARVRQRSTAQSSGTTNTDWRPALLLAAPLLGLALLPLKRRWQGARLPRVRTMDIAQPRADIAPTSPIADARTSAEDLAIGRPDSATPAAQPSQSANRPASSHETRPRGQLSPSLIPATVIPAGGACLADAGAALFTIQIDTLVQDGYVSVAVNLLEKSLDAGTAKNPWLLLQLLTLYERLGQTSDAARLISQLQTLYRVHLPTVGGLHEVGRDLLDHAELLAQVCAAWPSATLQSQLEHWLMAPTGPSWDLATFEDLLLLHAIVQNRSDDPPRLPVSPPPRLEHALEWTTDDH